jgi:multicomponent Na+:H+ antiporter subunit G
MDWFALAQTVAEWAIAVLAILAGIMSLAAGVGMIRFKDTLTRLHAGAKPQVLGVLLVALTVVIAHPTLPVMAMAFLVAVFQLLTQPIGAHMAARAAYRSPNLRKDLLLADELADDVQAADEHAGNADGTDKDGSGSRSAIARLLGRF